MANIIKGDDLMVFVNGSAIAFATSHNLTLTANTVEINSKSHGFWGQNEISTLGFEMSSENLYTAGDFDTLFSAWVSKTPVTLVFSQSKDSTAANTDGHALPEGDEWSSTGTKYTGKAYITSLSANAATGENATLSVTFSGCGPITKA